MKTLRFSHTVFRLKDRVFHSILENRSPYYSNPNVDYRRKKTRNLQ